MNIADLITKDRVQAVAELKSKKRALEALSDLLSQATPYLTETEVLSSLINREKLGSTGLGQGVAIPHGRVHGLDDTVGAFMRLDEGIDYESSDGGQVDLIFGLLVPEECTEEHLQVLARLAEMFTDDDFCTRLRRADADALHDLIAGYAPAPASHG